VPVLLLGALVAQAGLASPARAAAVRYAAPGGSGATCSAAAPCSIETAVNGAASGDEVVIAAGTYTTATSLSRNVSDLNIHGAAGQPTPVIHSSAGRAIDIGQSGRRTRISDLTIVHTGGQYGLNVFAKTTLIQRVSVTSSGAVACSPGISGMMRDSLCVSSAANGIAVDDSWSGDIGLLNLRNVTAIATGPGSYGIRADASGNNTDLDIDARNVIASGVAADVRSTESGTNSESLVQLRTSNYNQIVELGGGDITNVGSNSTNQTAAPVFLDTTTYRQAPGSPTIDKGTTYSDVGTADPEGQPRMMGAALDIGADEFDAVPPDVVFLHTPKRKLHKHKVTFLFTATEAAAFTCKMDKRKAVPCGSPFKVKVKRFGKHTITVTGRDAVGNLDPTPATYTWKLKHKHKKKKHHPHH
jgi:hypothetical protein